MTIEVCRKSTMFNKVVFINGFPGCGKTMLSPIMSSFKNVELMQYSNTIEVVCELWQIESIRKDVALSMIRKTADLILYNSLLGRNLNCRFSDISSIFNDRPLRYISRMLRKGEEQSIPLMSQTLKPILHITSHMLLPAYPLLKEALEENLVFIEVVRHPLYMFIQHKKNFEMFESTRNQHIRYTKNNIEHNFFEYGVEESYENLNSFEKAILSMKFYFDEIREKKSESIIFIPFEIFVKKPNEYMHLISDAIESKITRRVTKAMKKQNVPRKLLADSPSLEIYKRCGWTPPKSASEIEELAIRRNIISKEVSKEYLELIDSMSNSYEEEFLGGKL